jgi:hypothetical protein
MSLLNMFPVSLRAGTSLPPASVHLANVCKKVCCSNNKYGPIAGQRPGDKKINMSNTFASRAISQAVSRWLPTMTARFRSWVWSSGICGGQVFSKYFGFPCQSSFHQLLHNHPHLSSGAGTIGQKWPQYKGLSPS